ncbi:cytochrome P450 76T24-like [Rutidosis leptorrhynchoides]|uniref:cytochrome P450 76T24-like n=1 Tax=Rutidosis leptorrhynchoides TaxID=125765 RepID=UPI003A999B4C
MDYQIFVLTLSFLSLLIYLFIIPGHRDSRLPPGPNPLPIIGNLLLLGDKPHRSLATLSKRYGPLMSLKLGSRTTIVVSSPYIAKDFLSTHDQFFSNRSVQNTTRLLDHHKVSLAWMPANDQWRLLRRITKEFLFSGQCLDASEMLRQQKVQELVDHVSECCTSETAVNIGAVAFTTTLNILSNLMFSKDLSQYVTTASSHEFKDAIWGVMEIGARPNLIDFFPIFKPFDLQGLTRQGIIYSKILFGIFDEIIDQRLQTRTSSSSYEDVQPRKNDVLDLLIDFSLKNESVLSRNDIRHLFLDLFVAGTDTASTTLEWAMTELIRNPKKMETARLELIKVMKNNTKLILEDDIPQLRYLQAVIKETFRLHPPAPFLIPHEATRDVEVQGFIVPKNAQILCNVWAIGRDPKVWSDPETFMPERFLEVEIDYRGQDFELIPFGSGRRMCPGLNIANRMLHVMLGTLIYKFNWKLEGNMRAEDMNMDDKFGLTCPRSEPLIAVPTRN